MPVHPQGLGKLRPAVTSEMNGIDPQMWLADVLSHITAHPTCRLDELLPWNWTPPTSSIRSGSLILHVNRVHHVITINHVARDLGEDEDWQADVANEMEIEDRVMWVYGVGEYGILAFTDFGIENLIEFIKMNKDDPTLLKRYQPE